MFQRMLITDFTGVYREEGFEEALYQKGTDCRILVFSAMEGTKCYCSPDAAEAIRSSLLSVEPECRVHWIDSGDYHYMTYFFCERLRAPFTLLLFDHHRDDQEPAFDGVLSCGGWVAAMRRGNPFLKDVVTVGADGYIPFPEKISGPVYVSLDKDVFSTVYARTDWSQGTSSPDDVFCFIRQTLSSPENIVGFDICGELPPRNGGKPEDQRINLTTNLYITDQLKSLLI